MLASLLGEAKKGANTPKNPSIYSKAGQRPREFLSQPDQGAPPKPALSGASSPIPAQSTAAALTILPPSPIPAGASYWPDHNRTKPQIQPEASVRSPSSRKGARAERLPRRGFIHPERVHHYAAVLELRRPPNMPTRFMYSDTYRALSMNELQSEADLRRLPLDKENAEYLAKVLIVNDKSFSDCYHELERRYLSSEQLRDKAIMQQVPLDPEKHYNHPELLAEIAGQVGRNAVSTYNEQLKREEAAELQAANERAKRRQRQERARKAQEAEAARAKSNAAELVEAAAPKSRSKKSKPKEESMQERSHPNDSGYYTGQDSSLASASTSDPNKDMDQPKGKKRSGSILVDDEDTRPSKKRKSPPVAKVTRAIKSSSVRDSRRPGQLPQVSEDDSDSPCSHPSSETDMVMSDRPKPEAMVAGQRKAATPSSQNPKKRRTRSSKTTAELGYTAKIQKKAEKTEEEDDEDDWLVVDTNYKPKRKSKLGQMAASGLVAGMK